MATFRKLESGRWQAVVRKRGHKPVSKTFRTKHQASAWAVETEDAINRGTFNRVDNASIPALFDRYAAEITPNKRTSYREFNRIKRLQDYFKHDTTATMTTERIREFIEFRFDGVTADTVRKDLNLLSHLMTAAHALKWAHVPVNPVTAAKREMQITKESLPPGTVRLVRVSPADFDAILRHTTVNARPIFEWALETGMRRGEIANAKREHIRRLGNDWTIHVPENKTDHPRTIPLSGRAIEIYTSLPARIDGLIFGYSASSITTSFMRARDAAGLKNIRFHDLRHEAISRWFEGGLSVPEVASMSGHKDWRTLKRYTHVLPGEIARKLAVL